MMHLPPPRTDGISYFYWIPPGGYAYQMWRKRHFVRDGDNPFEFFGETERVSFLMDTEMGIMLKHGKLEDVQAEFKKYVDRGVAGSLSLLIVTFPAKYDAEEINRCLSTSGYLAILAQREGLLPSAAL